MWFVVALGVIVGLIAMCALVHHFLHDEEDWEENWTYGGWDLEEARRPWRDWADEHELEVESADRVPRFRIIGEIRGVPVEVEFVYAVSSAVEATRFEVRMPDVVPRALTVESAGALQLLEQRENIDIGYEPVGRHYRFAGWNDEAIVEFFGDSGIRHLMQRLAEGPASLRWEDRRLRAEVSGWLGPDSDGGEQLGLMIELAREVRMVHGAGASVLEFPDKEGVEEEGAGDGGDERLEWERPN